MINRDQTTTLQFETRTLIHHDTDADGNKLAIEREVNVCAGTGLGYYHNEEYYLIHVPSGTAFSELPMDTPEEIQDWIARIIDLDPNRWNISLQTFHHRYQDNKQTNRLLGRITLAHYDASAPVDRFFIAEKSDGEPLHPSEDAFSSNPLGTTNIKIVAEMFAYHAEASRIVMYEQDNAIGNSKSLHIYERADFIVETADIAIIQRGRILLIQRGRAPYTGMWALPGGKAKPGETREQTAHRELQEETGITGVPLQEIAKFDAPGRDPRGNYISTVFLACLSDDERITARAGDDAAQAAWFALDDLPALAFDHGDIIDKAKEHMRNEEVIR